MSKDEKWPVWDHLTRNMREMNFGHTFYWAKREQGQPWIIYDGTTFEILAVNLTTAEVSSWRPPVGC